MQTLFFWRDWSRTNRNIWFFLSAVLIFSIIFLWVSWYRDANNIIEWGRAQEQKVIETTVHSFRAGPFSLNVPAESYVIFEYLQGRYLQHNITASYIFLTVLMLSAMVLLSVITTLERFWYLAAMGLFVIFIASLRLDDLVLFGFSDYTVPIAVLVIFIAVSFYFKSFSPHASFLIRMLTFTGLAAVFGILLFFFSEAPFPLLQLAVASYTPALILSVIFILMVAHEILVSFVYIASQGGSKSLKHFSLITLIYLVNVLITCLHETGYLQWDFIYINLYFLLTLSGIIGIWGFRLRETLYGNILPFSPSGAFFFIAFATVCFITIAHQLANANDAVLKVIRELIIFSHAGFGIIFFTYIFSNYFGMMASDIPIHRVIYKPNRMPYFTFRLGGLIATLAFVFYMGWRDYVFQSMAGFYNYVGDLYMMQDNEAFGRSFYEQSRMHAFQNHRANYALATIKASRFDFEEAYKNYELANGRNPSDFSLVNQGNLYLWRKMYFPAINTFLENKKKKNSPALSNNLGFTYATIHDVDSTLYFINDARRDAFTAPSAEANFFALVSSEFLPIKTDSVLRLFNSDSPAVLANAVAAATLFRQDLSIKVDPLKDKELDLYSATLLNNYVVRNAKTLDSVFTNEALRIANNPDNFIFSEALKASLAYAYYHQSNVTKALEILGDVAYTTQDYRGKYNYIMGLWSLEQENPEVAIEYFRHAVGADHKEAKLYNAIALTEAGRVFEALIAWDTVSARELGATQMANEIKNILTLPASQAASLSDPQKYQYLRYRLGVNDTTEFIRLTNTFEFPDYKAQSLLDMAKKQYAADRIISAIQFLDKLTGLQLLDKKLYEDIQYFELRLLASRNEVRNLANQINKGVTFDTPHAQDKMLYTALIAEFSGDTLTAEKNYELLGKMNPFFEEGIIAAANFYRKKDSSGSRAYDILAEAIQVNSNSIRLLKEYAQEALRMGFDDYAATAHNTIIELEKNLR